MLNSIIQLMLPFLIFIGLIYIFVLVIRIIKQKSSKKYHQSSRFSLSSLAFSRLRRIKSKYLLGYTLVIILLIYQGNQRLINNYTGDILTRVIYNPKPGAESPWPWQDDKIHPEVHVGRAQAHLTRIW